MFDHRRESKYCSKHVEENLFYDVYEDSREYNKQARHKNNLHSIDVSSTVSFYLFHYVNNSQPTSFDFPCLFKPGLLFDRWRHRKLPSVPGFAWQRKQQQQQQKTLSY